jgi:hypothetical protein
VKQNEFLIFEDLKGVAKKKKEADRQSIGIFDLEQPPKTITCEEAVERVQAFAPRTNVDAGLVQNLRKLNRLRNQLEHYAIAADEEEVTKILSPLKDDFTEAKATMLDAARRTALDMDSLFRRLHHEQEG